MPHDTDVQGMFVVEGAAALQQLAERWRQKGRWAFQVLHVPAEPAGRGLALPPLPGEPPLNKSNAQSQCMRGHLPDKQLGEICMCLSLHWMLSTCEALGKANSFSAGIMHHRDEEP